MKHNFLAKIAFPTIPDHIQITVICTPITVMPRFFYHNDIFYTMQS